MSKSTAIQIKESNKPQFTFEAWLQFDTKKEASKALWEMKGIYTDRCACARDVGNNKISFVTTGPEQAKALGRMFEATTGWRTTIEERAASLKLHISTGGDTGYKGKLTQANYRWFFATGSLGNAFSYSEAFNWSDVERLAAQAGLEVQYSNDRNGRIIARK
jgi:hypothetical protein